MPDTLWKRHERKAAEDLGGKRNPLSGRLSGHTSGDVIHHLLYVECKYSKYFPLLRLMRQAEEDRAAKGTILLLPIQEKGQIHRYYVIRGDHLVRLLTYSPSVMREMFYARCIYKKVFAALTLMRQVEKNAKAEGKVPLVALQQKFLKHRYYVIRGDHLISLLRRRGCHLSLSL